MSFDVHVLGVGDTFSEFHHPTSLLLECDGFFLAIDCPDMYRRVLRDARMISQRPLDLLQIDHMLITHVHGDHMNGLEGVGFFKHFAQSKAMSLVASAEVREDLWDRRLAASMGQLWTGKEMKPMHFEDYFDFTELPWDAPLQVGPFSITSRRTKHHVTTSALRIEAGGVTLGYSADTAFDPGLIEWLSGADLIIHETNLGPSHTLYADLANLPTELQSKMRLVHYPDGFEKVTSKIALARQGDVLTIASARQS